MCVLKGFNNLAAKGSSAPNIFPFGIWFTNPDAAGNPQTVYVADEGPGVPGTGSPYAGASSDTNAGLEKWSFANGQWNYDYTIQAGLNLGQPYTVPGNIVRYVQPSTAQFTLRMEWRADHVSFSAWNGWSPDRTAPP